MVHSWEKHRSTWKWLCHPSDCLQPTIVFSLCRAWGSRAQIWETVEIGQRALAAGFSQAIVKQGLLQHCYTLLLFNVVERGPAATRPPALVPLPARLPPINHPCDPHYYRNLPRLLRLQPPGGTSTTSSAAVAGMLSTSSERRVRLHVCELYALFVGPLPVHLVAQYARQLTSTVLQRRTESERLALESTDPALMALLAAGRAASKRDAAANASGGLRGKGSGLGMPWGRRAPSAAAADVALPRIDSYVDFADD